jgi:hypothetical protein
MSQLTVQYVVQLLTCLLRLEGMCDLDRHAIAEAVLWVKQHKWLVAEVLPAMRRRLTKAEGRIPGAGRAPQGHGRVKGAICRNRCRLEGDKSIVRSSLWPRPAAPQVPADASVDGTSASNNHGFAGDLQQRTASPSRDWR